ncbi:non-canonical purine NTP pyrophosphatase, rdgB/HAM1 family [Geobacter metallireducens RCH3]|uniref:dITP/XTP pyrophosphatase n=1 Tax=Geobacter metallireducens (strain ATCC 53774 / DSM 7210 / GS-15) TaxID=269799 RepID=Q39UH0_GEOMG|nr:XTP/dITP diphosphatase [Geobacter metallireducens]ABB32104.1 xanthosine/inosine triphosphate pyrophosphohydrolase [Geobacter metallireducens GS-15]EHP88708.1 non-canonical purine NTP pyrophosphatase, rdgB/HAM1 family [Geobacter metallireducens RCH3]
MTDLIVATRNKGKLLEIGKILEGVHCRIYSLADFPDLPEIEEDGVTFEQNAIKKASAIAQLTGLPALADDSGLVVDALGGRPGVFSARYAGTGATDETNNAKLLEELRGTPPERRGAAFHCVIALCLPDGSCTTFSGELRGSILEVPQGGGGFGYDPLFFVEEEGSSLAELPLERKNRLSHRGKALELLKGKLSKA